MFLLSATRRSDIFQRETSLTAANCRWRFLLGEALEFTTGASANPKLYQFRVPSPGAGRREELSADR